ncbi:transcription factor 7-like 1-A [Corythoichthys intestinalis]|uniref:transcription factor 7-like 1-A n=1 Tax=Corythoichthys intestinalis TaxID=161448 RepID=UPI0025A60854|nr:transcription factor 7-like 1-A [Corythoichthys intestinalis]
MYTNAMESIQTLYGIEWHSLFDLVDHDFTCFAPSSSPAQEQHFSNDAGFCKGLPNPVEVSMKKRKLVQERNDYVKKPLNAFMIYAKEQRPLLKELHANKDSATINKLLGQMWKTLPLSDKEKYLEEQVRLEQEHAAKYPNWSARDNYGKRKRRKGSLASRCTSQLPADSPVAASPVDASPDASYLVALYPVAGYQVAASPVVAYPVPAAPVANYPVDAYLDAAYPFGTYMVNAAVAPASVAATVTHPPPSSADKTAELSFEQEFTEFLYELANLPFDQWPDHFIDL